MGRVRRQAARQPDDASVKGAHKLRNRTKGGVRLLQCKECKLRCGYAEKEAVMATKCPGKATAQR
jgi:hypothetical protein